MQNGRRLLKGLGAGLSLLGLVGCGAPSGMLPRTTEGTAQAKVELNLLRAMAVKDVKSGFSGYDRNGDGVLTRDEVPFLLPETFQKMDRNNDGRIDWNEGAPAESELKAMADLAGKVLKAAFQVLDRNHDDKLDASEASASGLFTEGTMAIGSSGMDYTSFLQALDRASEQPVAPVASDLKSDKPALFMVPGFFLPTAIWIPLAHKLGSMGWTHQATLGHWPSFGDIREYSAAAAWKIKQLQESSGASKVDVMGHSMGGLVLRYYIKHLGGDQVVSHYISFGTPQHGTVIGNIFPVLSAVQMEPNSDFLKELNAGDETPGDIKYTTLRTNTDEIVLNVNSPMLDGADNHYIPFAAHLELVYDPRSWKVVFDALAK